MNTRLIDLKVKSSGWSQLSPTPILLVTCAHGYLYLSVYVVNFVLYQQREI